MIHTVICAVKSKDRLIVQQFLERLASAGIKATDQTPTDSKYTYFDLCWDDADIQTTSKHPNIHRIGAKPKKLLHDGKPVTCGMVWQMRNGGMSDAVIGLVLDVSESTISRRRNKHIADGNFCKDSNTIF